MVKMDVLPSWRLNAWIELGPGLGGCWGCGNTSPPQPLFPLQEFLCGVPLPRVCQEQCVPVAGN